MSFKKIKHIYVTAKVKTVCFQMIQSLLCVKYTLIESFEQNFKNVLEKLDGWVPVVHFDALNQEAPSRVDVLISNFLRKFYSSKIFFRAFTLISRPQKWSFF